MIYRESRRGGSRVVGGLGSRTMSHSGLCLLLCLQMRGLQRGHDEQHTPGGGCCGRCVSHVVRRDVQTCVVRERVGGVGYQVYYEYPRFLTTPVMVVSLFVAGTLIRGWGCCSVVLCECPWDWLVWFTKVIVICVVPIVFVYCCRWM